MAANPVPYVRYLSIDVAYQTVGNFDGEFAPKEQIVELFLARMRLQREVESSPDTPATAEWFREAHARWVALFKTLIKIHRLDVKRCLPSGVKISQTSAAQRTQYLLDALKALSPDGDKRHVLLEEQPEIPGVSRKSCGAFYTMLSFFTLTGKSVTTVTPDVKTSVGFVCGLKEFRAFLKSKRPSITTHEAAKDFSKLNLKCIAMFMRDPSILKGVGEGANIPAANLDDAADAFMQAFVYHMTRT